MGVGGEREVAGLARRTNEERLAALDAKVAQLTARRDQLARQTQRAQRNRDQRTWMQIGRIMAGLGVDSVEKMRQLRDLMINEPQWEVWLESIGIVLVEDEDGRLTAVERPPADPPKGDGGDTPNND